MKLIDYLNDNEGVSELGSDLTAAFVSVCKYESKKQEAETEKEFAKRMFLDYAMNIYIEHKVKQASATINSVRETAIAEISALT